MRQKDPRSLVDQRRGRGRTTPRAKDARVRVPALPEEVAHPRAVWLPTAILEAFAANWKSRTQGVALADLTPEVVDAMIRKEAAAELEAIGKRAQELARRRWREWWTSDSAQAVRQKEDMEALRFWIVCVFERALFAPVVQAMPLVPGPNGNFVRNPLARAVRDCTAEIARVETAFGMSTRARFHLHLERPIDEPDDDELERAMKARPAPAGS